MGARSAAVREHIEAENRHDMPAMLATLAGEDPVRDEVAGSLYRGTDEVAARYAQLWSAFPDFTVTPMEILESEQACTMLADYTGTHRGGYLGFAPTGRRFVVRIAVVFRFLDRQIASETVYVDLAGQLRQLGLLDVMTEGTGRNQDGKLAPGSASQRVSPRPAVGLGLERDALSRIRVAAQRLRAAAARRPADRLTDPDPVTGEQWDTGQVLAHVAELLDYWNSQAWHILAIGGDAVVGRLETSPERIRRIEEGRHCEVAVLLQRIDAGVEDTAKLIRGLAPEHEQLLSRDPGEGEVTLAHLIEEYLVAHLEEHAAQFDS